MKVGDLQVWWVPQVPGPSFKVPVSSVAEGVKIMETLANYDLFQFENNIKPDYCNAGGLQRWCADFDGEGTPGWEDWYDEDSGEENPEMWLKETKKPEALQEDGPVVVLVGREADVAKFLSERRTWTSPTMIGREVWGPPHHSSTASPVCRRLVEKGVAVRNEKGHYMLTPRREFNDRS